MNCTKIFFMVLIFGLFVVGLPVSAEYTYSACSCTCGDNLIFSKGFGKNSNAAKESCYEMCARNCGSKTDCPTNELSDCAECCEDSACGAFEDDDAKTGCQESCESTCGFRSILKGLTDLIYAAAGIIAAIMIVIHGLKMLTSSDPESRRNSKHAILYVILALVIMGMAKVAVDTFAGNLGSGIETSTSPIVEGCGGEIQQVDQNVENGRITLSVNFINNGDEECAYRLGLYALDGTRLAVSPSSVGQTIGPSEIFNVKSGGLGTAEFTRNVNDIRNGYLIKLFRCEAASLAPGYDCNEEKETYTGTLPEEYLCKWEFTNDEPQFEDNTVSIPVHYENLGTQPCAYRVVYKNRDGETVRNTNFRQQNDWSGYLSLKEFMGKYTLVFEEEKAGDLSADENPITGDLLSSQGTALMSDIEHGLIECWENCKEKAQEDAKCFTFEPSSLKDTDRIWRDWIEEDLVKNEKKEVSDALDRWYADDPLKSSSDDFCIVFRKIGDREQVQVRKMSDDFCKDSKDMSEVCK